MLAGPQSSHSELEMSGDWSRDGYRIYGRIGKHVAKIARRLYPGIPPLDQLTFLRVKIDDGDDARIRYFREVSDQVRSPVAISNDADVDHCNESSLVCRVIS